MFVDHYQGIQMIWTLFRKRACGRREIALTKSPSRFRFAAFMGGLVILHGACFSAPAESSRTQSIQLQRGWNAVFLEVHPPDSDPGAVFAGTPIDLVASFYAPSSSAQFMTDPGADLFRQAGWGVWYAPSRVDAFLTTLHAIYGQQAYLIHSERDFTWHATGAVVPPEVRWAPDAYNFTGFSVHAQAGPTFAQFFAGSKAHRHNRIYRLVNGSWRRVSDPSAETIRSGEAFWIYCDGGSRYQGPLRVETTTRVGIFLGAGADTLILRNHSGYPVAPTLEHIVSSSNPVPLSLVIQAVGATSATVRRISTPQSAEGWTQPLPPLEAGEAIRVPLELRLQDMASASQASLLRISTDIGTEIWIPVIAVRQDLEER
jgi:hypothetical protein